MSLLAELYQLWVADIGTGADLGMRCQMKLCDQPSCSRGRSVQDTNSSYSHKLYYCFLVWDFGFFSPYYPLQHSKHLRRKNSTSANKT